MLAAHPAWFTEPSDRNWKVRQPLGSVDTTVPPAGAPVPLCQPPSGKPLLMPVKVLRIGVDAVVGPSNTYRASQPDSTVKELKFTITDSPGTSAQKVFTSLEFGR